MILMGDGHECEEPAWPEVVEIEISLSVSTPFMPPPTDNLKSTSEIISEACTLIISFLVKVQQSNS